MKVIIVEDNVLLAEGLRLMLDLAGDEVAAVLHDAESFPQAVERHDPDLVIMDVRLPPTHRDEGIRAASAARRRWPGLPILVLSQYVEHVYSAQLLAQGAAGIGYLLKDRVSRVDEFLDSMRRVASGGTAIDPEVIGELFRRQRAGSPVDSLTARERQVLALMAQGLSNSALAGSLTLTERAISKHIGNIFVKLGLSSDDDTAHRRVMAVLAFLNAEERG